MYELVEEMRNRYAAYSDFLSRFHLAGYKRFLVEISSEAMTIGTVGLTFLLVLALPAFEETNKNWRDPGKLSVTFLDRYGNEIGNKGILHDDAVPLEEIPKHMIQAALATEDRRFYDHFGIDVLGTMRAMLENVKANSVVQGGSSLTQQLAKNLFLSPERSLTRKIKELFLAFWLEGHFTKDQILKMYLDRAYMGAGTVGVEAAARFYFNKSIRDVTLAEAAMLGGMFKAPTTYAPHINLPNSRARANEVLSNMVEAGFLTEAQVYGARLNPASIVEKPNLYVPHYFLDWAYEEVERLVQGQGDYVLTARTTVDTELQKYAQSVVTDMLDKEGTAVNVRQAALVSMDTDGAVRAIVGGKDYDRSQFNRATQGRRQPGSSFKPYVYLAALQTGRYRPNSRVVDRPVVCGRKAFKNYNNSFAGVMTMSHALKKSINTVALDLSYKVGRKEVVKEVQKLGMNVVPSCSMALGDTAITPLQHTAGYATFANGGKIVQPYGILEIKNSKDEVLYNHEKTGPKPVQAFEKQNIEDLNYMMSLVNTEGTGRRAYLDFTATAGKTGTTSNYKDGWYVGYTGAFVTGVWYGNDNSQYMTRRGTGGNLPARTWKLYMEKAHEAIRPNIPQIPGVPLLEAQQEEMQQLAILQGESKAKVKKVKSVNVLPERTRRILLRIEKLLRDAQPVGKKANIKTKENDRKRLAKQ